MIWSLNTEDGMGCIFLEMDRKRKEEKDKGKSNFRNHLSNDECGINVNICRSDNFSEMILSLSGASILKMRSAQEKTDSYIAGKTKSVVSMNNAVTISRD
jgi:hypothetical protein